MENNGGKWVEVQDGEVVKLDVGQEVIGKLLAKREGDNGGIYDIESKSGTVTIFGTTLLDQKMKSVPEEATVRIERLKDRPSKTRGHSPMKVFTVRYMEANGE